ncbi:uncharacterized protein SRS1_14605 [Sporisorium reilianum f. sp. reilianum]|uniref:Uncharacterized protein n=1 Tax=Sporisorium reilianum f. sp. reilianum TaxID=72559 RepID=A0A2N8UHK2_9BASI|nr:uncharacterized protein SRS1_14605 [Sporisorium reilianum f. sp. reilianum]
MLPGYHRRLPAAAQELVDKALLDQDLTEAPADDARWVELYEQLQQLSEDGGSTDSVRSNAATTITDNDEEADYQWAPSSSDEATSSNKPAPQPHTHHPTLPPTLAISQAVHEYVSEALTNGKGHLAKHVDRQSWDAASLAALGMLVEEVARSQARFNAQRTMFAKSPRNQALAAKREASKREKGKSKEGS